MKLLYKYTIGFQLNLSCKSCHNFILRFFSYNRKIFNYKINFKRYLYLQVFFFVAFLKLYILYDNFIRNDCDERLFILNSNFP